MNFILYISRRLFGHGVGHKQVSHFAIKISTLNIILGVSIMILTLGIVQGFKQEIQKKVVSFGSHIQILNYNSFYAGENSPISFSDTMLEEIKSLPEVKNICQFAIKQGVLKTDDSFQGIVFRGYDEAYDLTFLRDALIAGKIDYPFSRKENTGRLYISKRVAQQLNIEIGDKVYAYFFDQRLRTRRFTVEGIYQSGIGDFDRNIAFCDYATAHRLLNINEDQCSGAEVMLTDFLQVDTLTQVLANLLSGKYDNYAQNYTAQNIRDLYPNIFSWLDLLDINIIVIFLLMIFVAGFSTISGLLIIILERVQFIGIMKSLGTSNITLRGIFTSYAIMIAMRGMLYGNMIGIGLCLIQKYTGIIQLDSTIYYVDSVPISMHWNYILLLNLLVGMLIVCSLLLPTLQISRIHPAKSIRFE